MLQLRRQRILVTGGHGFLGSHVVKLLQAEGVAEISRPTSYACDLREKEVCRQLVQNCDMVVHIAAHVGGIALNKAHPGQLFYDNASMGIHLLEEARVAAVKKVLIVGTACSYPKYCRVPFQEPDFWNGYPDEVTGVYGLAKKMLLVQAQAYRQEYGFNAIYLIVVNLYGPGDNFDPIFGHVIPSLIRRMVEAKLKRQKKFVAWGTGTATREFIYVEDAACGIIAALKHYNGGDPVNLGTGREISIRDLVITIQKIIGFTGTIVWDGTKPDGQPRRVVDTELARKYFNFEARTHFTAGLKKTIDWYMKHYLHQT